MATNRIFKIIENYMYMYHTDTFILLPVYPESISDTSAISFTHTTPLSRSAPIFSFQNAGPRSVQINLKLHRDLMTQVNYQRSNVQVAVGDDYVDTLVKQLQAAALPKYSVSAKMVDPPIVAIRFGNDVYCKGVVSGSVTTTYGLPIITDANGNDKYATIDISFAINEIDPYDADTVMTAGSFRGIDTSLERRLYSAGSGGL